MPTEASDDALAASMIERERTAVEEADSDLAGLPQSHFYLRPENLVGLDALRRMNQPVETMRSETPRRALDNLPPLSRLVDDIEADGKGLVMTMGKGGVGKTTIAVAVAVELAARGHEVLLTTTDPAAHLTENPCGRRRQPDRQPHRPRGGNPGLPRPYHGNPRCQPGCRGPQDAGGRSARSPCTEEIAVFQAFSKPYGKPGINL